MLGALSALVGAVLGLTAVAQPRPLPMRSMRDHLWLTGLALGLGICLGLANLGANYGMAMMDPAIYEQMVTRWAEFSSWSIVISGPIMEEIIFRLFLLTHGSALIWRVRRIRKSLFTRYLC